ncbi:PREDICTED: probable membrane-associated kinase regulator 5 [Camelina sativa]|uniref:Probable membrane-associated kinase regulator 5 n=1 Tax=Camelina sativa TaxID=90675 RepID=A0ABM0ULA7_CAMSA|nr:PREDICTED: probable membrane-associated kinase regulator 5 [Camelina sativa]
MEALSFMKFWLTNNNTTIKPRRETKISECAVDSTTASESPELDLCGEGDDSFFELEISLSDFKTERLETTTTTTFSVSNKSKILPFVDIATTKPQQSPTTLLKSGQKFRAFSFKKSTTTMTKKEENNRSLNMRFRTDDETMTSFRKTSSIARLQQTDDTTFDGSVSPVSSSSSSSKRFFSLIKPLYTKTTKKQSSSSGVSSSITSPTSSPAGREKQRSNLPSGIRSVRRQLGKSRSASSAIGGMSPANRVVDESFQVQQDGIQSAILHCKKSFHGSRESFLLSRSTSESSSQEKLSTSSSEDSYLFSRIGSDTMSEKSMDSLCSIKEQREKICD